ncbi:MAG: hypothetical protein ACE5IQ_00940 [Candidatus Methylomirabilales bacterium]
MGHLMAVPLPRTVQWLIGLSVLSFLFTVPHAAEDFLHGEAARLGLNNTAMAVGLAVAYAGQALGLALSARQNRVGHLAHLALGLVWCIGAVVIHLPEVLAPGPYREGPASQIFLFGVIISTGALAAASLLALRGLR